VVRSKTVVLLAAGVVLAAAPAAQARTIKLKGSEKGAVVSAQGATTVFAAVGSTKQGPYASKQVSTTGTPAADGSVPFTSTFVDYSGAGTEKGTITGTATPAGANAFTLKGTAKITGGSGKYRKARGSLTFTGTQTSDGRYTVAYTGTLTY
jgi:hypothetical protein